MPPEPASVDEARDADESDADEARASDSGREAGDRAAGTLARPGESAADPLDLEIADVVDPTLPLTVTDPGGSEPAAAVSEDEPAVPRTPHRVHQHRPTRRVVRVVRRVQLWSVFKVALLGALVFYGIGLGAVALLWSLANSTGQVHHIEKFMRDIGFDNWTFHGARLFTATAFIGAVLVVAGSVLTTLSAALLNLISELTGGIRFVIVEESPDDDLRPEDWDDDLDDGTRESRWSRRARSRA